jgi:hypothetical protein
VVLRPSPEQKITGSNPLQGGGFQAFIHGSAVVKTSQVSFFSHFSFLSGSLEKSSFCGSTAKKRQKL